MSTPAVRVTLKTDVHLIEHPSGLCARLRRAEPVRLVPWGIATWFASFREAERALAALGPQPLEIVRRAA